MDTKVNNNPNVQANATVTNQVDHSSKFNFLAFLFKKGLWGLALVIYGFVDAIIAAVDVAKDIKSDKINVGNELGANIKLMWQRCFQFIKKNKILNFKL